MIKIIAVGERTWELRDQRVFDALRRTIVSCLEPGGRGSRFPVFEAICQGRIESGQAAEAVRELQEIEAGLRDIPLDSPRWSQSDRGPVDSMAKPLAPNAANVLEYFAAADGRPMIVVLREAAEECQRTNQMLRLTYPGNAKRTLIAGMIFELIGFAWMGVGWALFPGLSLTRGFSRDASLPVWTFGMYVVMFGFALIIVGPFPKVGEWFGRRPVALIGVAIVAVIGWLAVCYCAGFLAA